MTESLVSVDFLMTCFLSVVSVAVSVLAGSVGSSNTDEFGTTVAGKISGSCGRITCVLIASLVIK